MSIFEFTYDIYEVLFLTDGGLLDWFNLSNTSIKEFVDNGSQWLYNIPLLGDAVEALNDILLNNSFGSLSLIQATLGLGLGFVVAWTLAKWFIQIIP